MREEITEFEYLREINSLVKQVVQNDKLFLHNRLEFIFDLLRGHEWIEDESIIFDILKYTRNISDLDGEMAKSSALWAMYADIIDQLNEKESING